MKNTIQNNSPELLPSPAVTKPISANFASAVQIAALIPFAGVDETFLRNRAREINPRTSAPWIPKPVNSQYEVTPTLCGLLEWFHAKANERDGLPANYGSMLDMQTALHISQKSIKWIRKNGAGEAKHESGRIDPRPILRRINEIIEAVADGTVSGIDGIEQWNKDKELAIKLREESEALKRKALIEAGEMLLAKDGSFAIEQLVADELIWEKVLQPARAALVSAPKNINKQLRSILNSPADGPEKIRRCAAVVTDSFAQLLDKLRAKKPKRLAE